MKQYLATLFLGLGLSQVALGKPPVLSPYVNYGVVSQAPVIDSTSFLNAGDFEIDSVSSFNLTNLNNLFGNGYTVLPFMTKDTLYFTNTGLMTGFPGFRFDTGTSTSRHNASFFLNEGTLEGIDTPAFLYLYGVPGSTTFVPFPANDQPIASQLLVLATNIVNSGSMSVGNAGLLRMVGKNVTNAYASLVAGSISTAGAAVDPLDTTGLQGQEEWETDLAGQFFFLDSPGVYDLFWGVTNAQNLDVTEFDPPNVPNIVVTGRGEDFGAPIPVNDNAVWSVSVFSYLGQGGTNIYFNIVFVNTNFADPNLTATVGFTEASEPQVANLLPPNDPNGEEAIVQFAEPVLDVITGQTVTNGVYLIDDGAYLGSMTVSVNGGVAGPYGRPNAFELTTETPLDWLESFPGNTTYDPSIFYQDQEFANKVVPSVIGEYGAQIGRNPGDLSGSFSSLVDTNTLASDFLLLNTVNLLDPTNDPGRIEITGANVDMTQTRWRAEGMVILNATNLIGGGTGAMDWGQINGAIGVTNGALVVSNLFPSTFQRVRGDIYAWSSSFQNIQTNLGSFANSNNPAPATNVIHYHVLVVDQNLFGKFPSTARNLKLTGKNSIVLQDNLNVINQEVFNTPNLIVTSTNFFSQNAANFTPANAPGLTNLLIAPTGVFAASSILDIGMNQSQGQGSPTGRKYAVNSIINFGQMVATAPLLQSAFIENAGQIISENRGSMVLEANVLSLGPALNNLTSFIDSQTNALGLSVTNSTNFLFADNSIDLSAATIQASNSVIEAGVAGAGSLTLDVTRELTDFVSGTPTTNTNSVIINHWTVTGGFSLPVKPAIGSLFGTEIHTIAAANQQAVHVWAGTDMGATPAGFVNNAAIGRLVLDRLTNNAVLRFSAAGAKNAMYVDYLELTNSAFSNYRSNLVIDPNFKIYFADCNADPEKLMDIYPGLVWVQNFAGPNSTQVVPYFESSNICLMNAALAQSSEISFFNGVANFYNQPYVLNNPSDPSQTYPCPGDETTTLRSMLVTTPAAGGGGTLNLLNIAINGEGSISPDIQTGQLALGSSHTLTATAAKGWVFQNWSTIGLNGKVNVNSRVLSFTFLTNTVITANFMPNPFTETQGSYNGLFYDTNAVNPNTSGAFSLTLTPSGSFSGRLLIGPTVYNFNSQFSGAGGAQFTAKAGAQSLTVNLQLDMTSQSGQIRGDINGAALVANIMPMWTTQNPSPLAGSYTMVLPWETGTVGTPGGESYGVVTINQQGVLSVAGTLADGATFSASAPVSQGGQWPFYAYAPSGKDSVLGWVTVGNGLSGTNVNWSKAAGTGSLYGAGFSNVLQLVGSPWQAPSKQSAALTLTNPVVILSGGNLPGPLTNSVALQNLLNYAGANLTLSIRPSNGSFSGSFNSPVTGGKQAISGVVLQNEGRALGLFPGTNESGAVLLEGQ